MWGLCRALCNGCYYGLVFILEHIDAWFLIIHTPALIQWIIHNKDSCFLAKRQKDGF